MDVASFVSRMHDFRLTWIMAVNSSSSSSSSCIKLGKQYNKWWNGSSGGHDLMQTNIKHFIASVNSLARFMKYDFNFIIPQRQQQLPSGQSGRRHGGRIMSEWHVWLILSFKITNLLYTNRESTCFPSIFIFAWLLRKNIAALDLISLPHFIQFTCRDIHIYI